MSDPLEGQKGSVSIRVRIFNNFFADVRKGTQILSLFAITTAGDVPGGEAEHEIYPADTCKNAN